MSQQQPQWQFNQGEFHQSLQKLSISCWQTTASSRRERNSENRNRFVRRVRVTDKNKDALLMVRRRRVFLSRLSFNYVSCALIIVRFTHFLLPTIKILAFVSVFLRYNKCCVCDCESKSNRKVLAFAWPSLMSSLSSFALRLTYTREREGERPFWWNCFLLFTNFLVPVFWWRQIIHNYKI